MAILERHDEPVVLHIAGHDFNAKKVSGIDIYKIGVDENNGKHTPLESVVKVLYLAIKDNYPDETYEKMADFFTLDMYPSLREELKKVGMDNGADKKKEELNTTQSTTSI